MAIWDRARAEGRIKEMNGVDMALYLLKYLLRPQLTTTADISSHFQKQKEIQPLLPRSPISPLATLGFVGDLMWIRRNWNGFLPASTLKQLSKYDGLVGNLETVISSNVPVNEFWPDLIFFNSKPELVSSFRRPTNENLFAALSFANNHTLDHGDAAALDTLEFLKSQGIPQSGLAQRGEKKWTEFSRGGIRFGFYAATFGLNDPARLENSSLQLNTVPGLAPDNSPALPDLSEAKAALVEMTDAGIEIKIVFLHWGHEFEFYPTERMIAVGRELVTAGADIITGSHPHIPQPAEILLVNGYAPAIESPSRITAPGRDRKALIIYSLGNFATAMFTTYCRIAPLWPVSFYRENGQVDWDLGSAEFFFNRSFRGGTELVGMNEYQASAREKSRLQRVIRHLGGLFE